MGDVEEIVRLHFSQGEIDARVGDRFGWWDDTVWEIVRFTNGRSYSPSGFGGTPTVIVRHLHGELTPHMQQYLTDGCTEWCGDSVGAGLHFYKGRIPDHLLSSKEGE